MHRGSERHDLAEDRFFGVYEPGGISSIALSNSSGGIEMDHIQFGLVGLATMTTTTTTVTTTLVTSTSTTGAVPSTTATPTTSSTTTTTTLAGGCPAGATFDAILCLLDQLIADEDSAPDLGRLRTGIRNAVVKARKQAAKARDAGAGKVAKTQLKKASHSLVTFEHKLASNNAKKIGQATRDGLRAASAGIRGEMQTLRGTL